MADPARAKKIADRIKVLVAEPLVLDAVLQRLGNQHLDAVGNLLRACRISHGLSLPSEITGLRDERRSSARDLAHLVGLDDVVNPDVVEAAQVDTALEA